MGCILPRIFKKGDKKMSEIQEMIQKAKVALEEYESYNQEQVDAICRAVAKSIYDNAVDLAKMAVDETGIGSVAAKTEKNQAASAGIWGFMKGKKSVGIIGEDKEKNMIYVAHPKGVVSSVAPATNPTVTPLGNALCCLKGRNVLIVSPHPAAYRTTVETIKIMTEAAKKAGAPDNVIQLVKDPSNEASQELMALSDTVIATGGKLMVKAAYSSGVPAYGVGPGNMQAIIAEDYTDYDKAAQDIVVSRDFDHGSVCASDQACLVQKNHRQEMIDAFRRNGAYFIDDEKLVDKFRNTIFINGLTNGKLVARSAQAVAAAAGIEIPEDARIIVLEVKKHGREELLCGEKLCPVLAFLTYDTFDDAVRIAKDNILYVGTGHSANIHSNDLEKVKKLANSLPTGRILVNMPGSTAAGGPTNHLTPTTSIGCGSWGGNSITDNLNYEYLLNVQRIVMPRTDKAPTDEEIWAE